MEEFQALAALPDFPWDAEDLERWGNVPSGLPVPIHRISGAAVNKTLETYAGGEAPFPPANRSPPGPSPSGFPPAGRFPEGPPPAGSRDSFPPRRRQGPVMLRLPNSGILIQYTMMYGLNPDGSSSEEAGTGRAW